MLKWSCISQGCYPKVIARSYQGHSKVKSAQKAENILFLFIFSTIMFTLDVNDDLKHT